MTPKQRWLRDSSGPVDPDQPKSTLEDILAVHHPPTPNLHMSFYLNYIQNRLICYVSLECALRNHTEDQHAQKYCDEITDVF